MNKVIEINILEHKKLLIQFQDGVSKIIDFKPFIGKGVSVPLDDPEYFNKISIDNGGGIEWPNGFDFCPNFLRES